MKSHLALLLLLIAFAAPIPTEAQSRSACIEDAAGLAAPARAAFQKEFQRMVAPLGLAASWSKARRCPTASIRIQILSSADDAPADALGRARLVDGYVSGDIQVFLAPVIDCDCIQGWEGVGRVLARVAAHETVHHLQQQAGRHGDGLMQAAIPVRELGAPDSAGRPWSAY